MRNFGKQNIGKKTWGVLGKRETYYYQPGLATNKEKTPLNANPLEEWDYKKSKYKRIDLMPKVQMENDGQQAGVVGSAVGPTPTPTMTPTNTSTNTPTPSITPSSTPYPLPLEPALWYDSTNLGSIDYISSGGTNYVSAWRSLGTYQKTLSGDSINTMPIWSGSSQLPGSPLVVRFTKNANGLLQDYLTQRFDSTSIPYSGVTIFQVFTKPDGLVYSGTSNATGFGYPFIVASGNTTNGGFTSGITPTFYIQINVGTTTGINTIGNQKGDFGYVNNTPISNFSATSLNNKFLYHITMPYPTGSAYFELNQSGGTNTQFPITASTANVNLNQVFLGRQWGNSGGTLNIINNAGGEVAEIMMFNRELSIQEQEQVQNYLRDKWRYDEWASPVPTPTTTYTPTATATPTQTNTSTTTPTPSPTSSLDADASLYLEAVVQAGGTGITATVSAATQTMFTSLKSANIYNKIDALYPFLGGNASSAKWNAKNPIDTNAAFRLVFFGGGTFTQQKGFIGNGSNAYADTYWIQNAQTTTGNTSLGVFITQTGATGFDIGSNISSVWVGFDSARTATQFRGGLETGLTNYTGQTPSQAINFNAISRQDNSTVLFVARGSGVQSLASTGVSTLQNISTLIGQANGFGDYSTRAYGTVFIGEGMSTIELGNLRDIITTFNTTLGRNL